MDESINKWVTKRWTERDKEYERQEEERQKYCTFKPQIHAGTQKIWEARVSEIKARNGGECSLQMRYDQNSVAMKDIFKVFNMLYWTVSTYRNVMIDLLANFSNTPWS